MIGESVNLLVAVVILAPQNISFTLCFLVSKRKKEIL